jgi:hypothetical protein
MNNNVWKKTLRACLFTLVLAASAAATLMPDWATTLKAQGHYGSVDLSLYVQPSTPALSAGTDTDLLITLANAGPDDAYRARTSALIDGEAFATATSGCNEFPLGFPDCTLSAPLLAGGSADYLMTLSVAPLARGSVTVAIAATSDDAEIAPGQELVLLDLPIEAHVDLQVSGACNRGYLMPDVPLSCRVKFYNAGPAGAISPLLYINTFGYFSNVTCDAPRSDMCTSYMPATWWPNTLLPGETITLGFDITLTPDLGVETWQMFVGAQPNEILDVPEHSTAEFTLPVSLFADDFEGDPPSL